VVDSRLRLVACPSFLPSSPLPAQIADEVELHSIRDRQWQIQACSAKDGEGLEDGLSWLIKQTNKKASAAAAATATDERKAHA